MKAVLLKALRVNGVSVARAAEGPTIIDVVDAEFEKLETRGVVRLATKADLALAGMPDPDPDAAAAEKAAAAEAAAAKATKKPGKAEKPAADDDL